MPFNFYMFTSAHSRICFYGRCFVSSPFFLFQCICTTPPRQESWLHVRIVEAKNLESLSGSSASPHCTMRIGSDGPVKLQTAVRKNTLNPVL